MELWHPRLGHLNVKSINALQSIMRDINPCKTCCHIVIFVCETCTKGKKYGTKLGNNTERRVTKSLEIVFLGVCAPMRNVSMKRTKTLLISLRIFKGGVSLYDEIQRRWV